MRWLGKIDPGSGVGRDGQLAIFRRPNAIADANVAVDLTRVIGGLVEVVDPLIPRGAGRQWKAIAQQRRREAAGLDVHQCAGSHETGRRENFLAFDIDRRALERHAHIVVMFAVIEMEAYSLRCP